MRIRHQRWGKVLQILLGVDSLEEMVLKLAKTKQQQKQLLEFLQRNLEENPA
jgi:hypothetical protein